MPERGLSGRVETPFVSSSSSLRVRPYLTDTTRVDSAWQQISSRVSSFEPGELDTVFRGLPGARHRPLLTAALLIELSERDRAAKLTNPLPQETIGELINRSRIATIHRLPYTALHLPDVIEEMGGLEEIDIDKIYEYFCGSTSIDGEKNL